MNKFIIPKDAFILQVIEKTDGSVGIPNEFLQEWMQNVPINKLHHQQDEFEYTDYNNIVSNSLPNKSHCHYIPPYKAKNDESEIDHTPQVTAGTAKTVITPDLPPSHCPATHSHCKWDTTPTHPPSHHTTITCSRHKQNQYIIQDHTSNKAGDEDEYKIDSFMAGSNEESDIDMDEDDDFETCGVDDCDDATTAHNKSTKTKPTMTTSQPDKPLAVFGAPSHIKELILNLKSDPYVKHLVGSDETICLVHPSHTAYHMHLMMEENGINPTDLATVLGLLTKTNQNTHSLLGGLLHAILDAPTGNVPSHIYKSCQKVLRGEELTIEQSIHFCHYNGHSNCTAADLAFTKWPVEGLGRVTSQCDTNNILGKISKSNAELDDTKTAWIKTNLEAWPITHTYQQHIILAKGCFGATSCNLSIDKMVDKMIHNDVAFNKFGDKPFSILQQTFPNIIDKLHAGYMLFPTEIDILDNNNLVKKLDLDENIVARAHHTNTTNIHQTYADTPLLLSSISNLLMAASCATFIHEPKLQTTFLINEYDDPTTVVTNDC